MSKLKRPAASRASDRRCSRGSVMRAAETTAAIGSSRPPRSTSTASATRLPFDIDGRHILLIDDVLYTGRTLRAVVNELFDFGRPASVTLAVLVDRGGRELPVAAAFAAARIVLDRKSVV